MERIDKKIAKINKTGLSRRSSVYLPDWKKKAANAVKKEFPSPSEFVVGCNMEAMTERYSGTSRKKMILKDTFNISDLKYIYSEKTPTMLIEAYLIHLNVYSNFKEEKKMNEFQIRTCARQLFKTMAGVTLAELWLFFDRIMSGYFGVFYNNIDPVCINKWAKDYMLERGMMMLRDQDIRKCLDDRMFNKKDKKNENKTM